jgi:hypothetical protein
LDDKDYALRYVESKKSFRDFAMLCMDNEQPKPKKRLNARQKRQLRAEELRLFVQQIGRKAPKRGEPNDRRYSRDVERASRQLRPETWDQILHRSDDDVGDEDNDDA